MVDLAEIQAAYYMVAATGVLVAAGYYVMNIRNYARERRKQTILMKLPPMTKEYYEWNLQIRLDPVTSEIWEKKYQMNPENQSKMQYITNIYAVVGQLYEEGLMSLEEVAQAYSPGWLISWWDMFEWFFVKIRYTPEGEAAWPGYLRGFERLVKDLRARYPLVMKVQQRFREENEELLRKENSK